MPVGVQRAAGLANGPSARPFLRARRRAAGPCTDSSHVRNAERSRLFPTCVSSLSRGHAEATRPFPSLTSGFLRGAWGTHFCTSVEGTSRVELPLVAMPTHPERPSLYTWIPSGALAAAPPSISLVSRVQTSRAWQPGEPRPPRHPELHGSSTVAPAAAPKRLPCVNGEASALTGLRDRHRRGHPGPGEAPWRGGLSWAGSHRPGEGHGRALAAHPLSESPGRTPLPVSGTQETSGAGEQSWGVTRAEEGGLTSVTLTTPICGADRSMSNVFSQ